MRTFVAVFPPLGIRVATAAGAREAVQRLGAGFADRVRWAKPENVHLTLKFLGEVWEEDLGDVRAALGKVCSRHAPFEAELVGLGAFPSARRARVLWAGVGAGFKELRSVASDLDETLAPLGFEREKRPYTPHLTLGRVLGRPAHFSDLLSEDARGPKFPVRHVEFVESTLTLEGAVYETLGAFALGEDSRRTG
ncbi:MAG: RNA 2',3'-cyclic phosphodiesterase [Actinomycetota bacterium]|nr:RNA 2',3'-cyclic phosphodiesterase [Actinomycetota bacterium]